MHTEKARTNGDLTDVPLIAVKELTLSYYTGKP